MNAEIDPLTSLLMRLACWWPAGVRPRALARMAAALMLCTICLGACASPRRDAPLEPSLPSIFAVRPGRLVIPVDLPPDARSTRSPDCRLDDGRPLGASLHWIGVRETEGFTGYRWLPDPLEWRAWPAGDEPPPTPAGFWAISVDVPPGAVGQGIWIDDTRLDVAWVPDPALATLHGDPMPWRTPLPRAALRSPALARLVDPVRRNPLTRWRYLLILDGLRPDRPADAASLDGVQPTTFDDPVLEALARHTEDLWRAALVRLRQDDLDLARRFERRLVEVVDFGDGVFAPAWPTDQLVLETLLDSLLSRRATPESRTQAVAQWLDEQPPAVAWVVDDAGRRDPLSGHALASVGVANLGRGAMLASATDPRDATRRDSILVRAGAAATLSVPVAPPPSGSPTARVEVEMGRWRAARPIIAGAVEARPPGVVMSPFVGDWTMSGWFVGAATRGVRADGHLIGAARLERVGAEGAWALYLECRRPLDDRFATPRPGTDWVRVWIGPRDRPSAVLRVWHDGRVFDETAQDPASPNDRATVPGARVVDEQDRWTAIVPIIPALVEPDGTIRIGLERIDGRGRRWAWPEPMLPWQIEPARVTIDLSTWDQLVDPGATPHPGRASARPMSITRD